MSVFRALSTMAKKDSPVLDRTSVERLIRTKGKVPSMFSGAIVNKEDW